MENNHSRRFSEYLTDGRFARSYGFNKKGIIYIEDYNDKSFWTSFTNEYLNDDYDIKCTTNEENKVVTGKRNLEKLYEKLNKDVLVAIDADYDTLAPNRSEYSIVVKKSPYILNTYGYSRESILCSKNALKEHLNAMALSEEIQFDIVSFLNEISKIIYETLPELLFSINKNNKQISEKSFKKAISITDKEASEIINGNFKKITEIHEKLNKIIEKTNRKQEDLTVYKKTIIDDGFNESNAYQFLCGHTLLDNIVEPIFKAILKHQQKIEMQKIELNYTEKERIDRRKQVLNHFNENCSYKTLINTYNNNNIKDDEVFKKVIEKTIFLNK